MSGRSERFEFDNGRGQVLAAALERPIGPVRAAALFAHCFTCSKDLRAVRRLAARLREEGFAVGPGATGENLTVQGLDVDALKIGDRLRFDGGVEVESIGIDRQVNEHLSGGGFEGVDRPGDHRPQRLVMWLVDDVGAAQVVEPVGQELLDVGDVERAGAGGGELDGEG